MEVDSDLYGRLVKSSVLKANTKSRLTGPLNDGNKKVLLDIEGSQLFESGIALSKYLISLKDVLTVR